MKEQKVLITTSQKEVNDMIEKGWFVVSVTAQNVATSVAHQGTASYSSIELKGNFCFVLEKQK